MMGSIMQNKTIVWRERASSESGTGKDVSFDVTDQLTEIARTFQFSLI